MTLNKVIEMVVVGKVFLKVKLLNCMHAYNIVMFARTTVCKHYSSSIH